MNKLRSRKFMAGLSLMATAGLFATTGYSQAAAPTQTTTPPVETMEKFEVTGSYLPPAANSVAIPVITVDSTEIANSGNTTSVLEILRKTTPQFSGNGNVGAQNANVGEQSTLGGSALALRNASTLVLVNGRRMAGSPVAATTNGAFVDVNQIPVAAIDRIEILADGASAIYGTDAVSGVVNIILKSDYEGFESGGRYGWSTDQGHYAERSGYVVGGVSDGKSSMTLSAEWYKQDPIFNYERPYSASTFGTATFPGSTSIGTAYYNLAPGLNAAPVTPGGLSPAQLVTNGTYNGPNTSSVQFLLFNLSQYVTQQLADDRRSMTLAFDHKIGEKFKAFGDFMYSNTHTLSQINGQPITLSIPAGSPNDPFNVTVTGRNRLLSYPRQYINDEVGLRGIIGLKGQLTSDWSFETAVDYSRVNDNYQNPGVINNAHLTNAALVTGAFNFFARVQANPTEVVTDGIVGVATGGFFSALESYDFKLIGKLFDLPAGPVDIATGGEIRHEQVSAVADALSQIDPVTGALGWNGATTLYPFKTSRSVEGLFAEVRIPVLKDTPGAHLLEVSGAVRHEYYSDTTNPTVPKITVRYLPINDEFALRGTYSRSFTAPTLFNLYGPNSIGFTSSYNLLPAGGGAALPNTQNNSESGSNPHLNPSKSKNYTLGFVYSPKAVKGLSFTVDYYNVKQTDLISSIGATTIAQDVETNGPASQYASHVHFGSFTGPGVTAKGQISTAIPDNVYIVDTLTNIAAQNFSGFDVTGKYTYNADSVGRFDFQSNIGIYKSYTIQTLPGTAPLETVALVTASNGTLPRWQTYTSMDFHRGNYEAFVGVRYLPSLTDLNSGLPVGSFQTWDLSASYAFGSEVKLLSGAKLTFGVNNVFNKFGPLDQATWSDSNVDTGTYGAIGRFVYVDLKYKF